MERSPERGVVLSVKDLTVQFSRPGSLLRGLLGSSRPSFQAVDGVSFQIHENEILGLAGESGCGKTTTGMTLVRLYRPTTGQIQFEGVDITHLNDRQLKQFRRRAQIIFQNPYESLNPRYRVADAIGEMLDIHGIGAPAERRQLVAEALREAGLVPPETYLARFPHQLSGGERQRVAIARAMVLRPRFIVADEPVAMLDVSIQAGILNLLKSMAASQSTSILYISHDLSSIKYLCRRVLIMYLGVVVESGPTHEVIAEPLHPYTQLLIASIPVPDPMAKRPRVAVDMGPSSQATKSPGCRYATRCPFVMDVCRRVEPALQPVRPGRAVACHLYEPGVTERAVDGPTY